MTHYVPILWPYFIPLLLSRYKCNIPKCTSGTPICLSGAIPTCGAIFGFRGELGDSGCVDESFSYFEKGAAFCTTKTKPAARNIKTCTKTNLCPSNRKRFASCREDKTSCKCVCQFKFLHQKYTPRCSENDIPTCSGGLKPACLEKGNEPGCYNGKLVCEDEENDFVDLTDIVICK